MAHTFEAEVEVEGRTATFLKVPLDVRAEFGKARPPVRVTVGGHTYRTTVATYGGEYFLPLNRKNREAAGVQAGERVEVTIELDDAPREVVVPDDLAEALAGAGGAREAWDKLSFTHQREYAEWIDEAKKPDTRARRIGQTVERISEG